MLAILETEAQGENGIDTAIIDIIDDEDSELTSC